MIKKFALAAAAAAAFASASAFGIQEPGQLLQTPADPAVRIVELPGNLTTAAKERPLSRAGVEEVLYMPAEDPYQVFGYNNQVAGMQIGMAMQLEPSFVTTMDGGEITGIVFYTGLENGLQENKIRRATVFVTNDLMADPVITQETNCTAEPAARVEVSLDTPYKIEAGKKVYVGVYMSLNSANSLPVVTDYVGHANDYGGWVGVRSSAGAAWSWSNIASMYGFVCVGATIRGEFAQDNVSITDIDGVPVSYQGTPFEVDFLFQNNGSNDVSSIKVEYDVDGEGASSGTVSMPSPVSFNKSAVIRLPEVVAPSAAKKANVNVRVTEVNGRPNTAADNSARFPVTIVPSGKGFDRNVVVEEFTSISCVFCPVGYTGMEYVHENYTDGSLIPVAVHVNSPGADPMTATTFGNVYNRYCTNGVPSAIMNRSYDLYPTTDNLVSLYEAIRSLPALAKVEAEAAYDADRGILTVDTRAAFSFDYTDGNFALSYAVTENNVGPYNQKNGYSGEEGDYYGWQDLPSVVSLMYNDVARQLDSFTGVAGSIPAEITAGTEYVFSRDIKPVQAIKDVNNINVIVYLIDKATGAIENAAMVRSADISGLSGLENVAVDSTSVPAVYYDLQGRRVARPFSGLYIRRQGSSATKVLIN